MSFSSKKPGSIAILIACVILIVLAIFSVVCGAATVSDLTGVQKEGESQSGDITGCDLARLTANQRDLLEKNTPTYQEAASKVGVPWQVLAAIHYREHGFDPNPSDKNPYQHGHLQFSSFLDASIDAGKHAQAMVKSVYGKTLTASSDEETIKLAFLAYNRGSMYKTGGCNYDQSPYVMNKFDSTHQNMTFPNSSCEPPSTRGRIDANLGAYTIYNMLTSCGGATSNAQFVGKTALPMNPKDIIRYNTSLHGKSISRPSSAPGHDVFLGPYDSNYGTGLKHQFGEAVDLFAKSGTPIYATFDGKIWRRWNSTGGNGQVLLIKSTDGHSYAILAHINPFVSASQQVTAGQKVGTVAPIGGDHLHFELWISDKPIDAGTNPKPVDIWNAQKKALGF